MFWIESRAQKKIQRIDDGRSQCTNSFIEVLPSCRAFFLQLKKERGNRVSKKERERRGGGGGGKKELIWTPIGSANVGQT